MNAPLIRATSELGIAILSEWGASFHLLQGAVDREDTFENKEHAYYMNKHGLTIATRILCEAIRTGHLRVDDSTDKQKEELDET